VTPLPLHDITVHAASRSLTLFFREHSTPAQLVEAIAAREGDWMDEPAFRRLVEWIGKDRFVSVKREVWGNEVLAELSR